MNRDAFLATVQVAELSVYIAAQLVMFAFFFFFSFCSRSGFLAILTACCATLGKMRGAESKLNTMALDGPKFIEREGYQKVERTTTNSATLAPRPFDRGTQNVRFADHVTPTRRGWELH